VTQELHLLSRVTVGNILRNAVLLLFALFWGITSTGAQQNGQVDWAAVWRQTAPPPRAKIVRRDGQLPITDPGLEQRGDGFQETRLLLANVSPEYYEPETRRAVLIMPREELETALPVSVRPRPLVYRPNITSRRGLVLDGCHRLSRLGLRYLYGGEHPENGGMDCSGTVQYVLEQAGFQNVPRQANTQYLWLEKRGTLTKIRPWTSPRSVFHRLRPGDLLFWKGTYKVRRVPNVTHVMIYMGRETKSGKHLMFGARGTRAKGRNGSAVDIFEFRWPEKRRRGKFIAFGSVPGIGG